MGTYTPKLDLFKVDPSIGASDPVDVNLDLDGNYDIIDDNASIRTRPNGVFPDSSQSYQGGILYHPSGKISNYWSDNQWHTLKNLNSYVGKTGATNQTVPTGVTTYLTWNSYTDSKDALSFLSEGSIQFKKAGLYRVTLNMDVSGIGGPYNRVTSIVMTDAANNPKQRWLTTRNTFGALVCCGALIPVTSAMLNWKVRGALYQESGSSFNYGTSQSNFYAIRLGGFLGD